VTTGSGPERLRELQFAFAGHIRDPKHTATPDGVEDRRMKIYRELFFNNIQSLLASNFPVIRKLCDDDDWRRLIRDFYREHRCQTPLFPEVAREFLRYLQDNRKECPDDPPFLLELAHYEWVELALALDEREISVPGCDPGGDLLSGRPLLSPVAWPLSYRFPVHRITPDYRPQDPPAEATHLLVYRDREDEVRFMQLNAVSRLLLERLRSENDHSGRQMLEEIAAAIRHPAPQRVIEAGAELLEDLRNRGVVPGTRIDNDV
jgi:hypothetical protein